MISLIKKISFKNNDVYFMDRFHNGLILNNRHAGIMLLDSELIKLKELSFNQTIAFDYPIFTSLSSLGLIIYVWEDGYLLHINFDKNLFRKISLANYSQYYLSKIYWWTDTKIVFYALSHDTFLLLDLHEGKLKGLSLNDVARLYPSYYNFYIQVRDYTNSQFELIERCYPYKKELLFKDESSNIAIVKNFESGQEYKCAMPSIDFYDIRYSNSLFSFLAEDIILFKNSVSHQEETLLPDKKCRFLRNSFLDGGTVAVLSGALSGGFNVETQKGFGTEYLATYKIFEN